MVDEKQPVTFVDEGWTAEQGPEALAAWLDADQTGVRREAFESIEAQQSAPDGEGE